MAPGTVSLSSEVGVFTPDAWDDLLAFYRAHGFAVLRGMWDEEVLDALTVACVSAQQRLVDGRLSQRHGTLELVDDEDGQRTARFANYVARITEVDPAIRTAVLEPALVELAKAILGPDCWLLEGDPFGVLYQDVRTSRDSSYTRIGWHSDWQSGPHLDKWPSVAFTIHIDGTGPDNGFLRVVPGSHLWATPAPYRNVNNVRVPESSRPTGGYTDTPPPLEMPLGFEKIPGELAVYCERGDVLFHDAYLWHSAARATTDDAVRRHVRGGWYSGDPDKAGGVEDFVKNAAR
jgi:hypothetical protein